MPYKSEAQRKYFNEHREELKKQGVDVDEWNKASEGMKLPSKLTKKGKTEKTSPTKHAFSWLGK